MNILSPDLFELQARLEAVFAKQSEPYAALTQKERDKISRQVRKEFNWIYTLRKALFFDHELTDIKMQKLNTCIQTIMNWPLWSHHSLKRFDELTWDLTHIFAMTKAKKNVELTWIRPFLNSYINKCIDYFEMKIYEHEISLDGCEKGLESGKDILTKLHWEKILTHKKPDGNFVHKIPEDGDAACKLLKIKVRTYKRLVKKYKQYVREYKQRRERLDIMLVDLLNLP